jgi:hypothetical protein
MWLETVHDFFKNLFKRSLLETVLYSRSLLKGVGLYKTSQK